MPPKKREMHLLTVWMYHTVSTQETVEPNRFHLLIVESSSCQVGKKLKNQTDKNERVTWKGGMRSGGGEGRDEGQQRRWGRASGASVKRGMVGGGLLWFLQPCLSTFPRKSLDPICEVRCVMWMTAAAKLTCFQFSLLSEIICIWCHLFSKWLKVANQRRRVLCLCHHFLLSRLKSNYCLKSLSFRGLKTPQCGCQATAMQFRAETCKCACNLLIWETCRSNT